MTKIATLRNTFYLIIPIENFFETLQKSSIENIFQIPKLNGDNKKFNKRSGKNANKSEVQDSEEWYLCSRFVW